jgi:LPXTG-motif cell wall-anchored protein
MYALPHTGAGSMLLAVVAVVVTAIGALFTWVGRRLSRSPR